MIKGQALIGVTKKRDFKILTSFTQSVLPIILGNTLWQLPSTFSWASKMKQRKDNIVNDSMFKHDRNQIIPTSAEVRNITLHNSASEYDPHVYSASLNGNAMMQSMFIQMIQALSSILGNKFNDFIPVVLYPLLQKTSDINCVILQKTAFDTIKQMSLSSGYASVDEMLSVQFRFIVEIISVELRGSFLESENHLRQQAVCFYSLHKVLKFMLESLTSERNQIQTTEMDSTTIDNTQLIVLLDMMQTINSWFNNNFKKDIKSLVALMMVPLSMLQVFKACIEYMDILVKFHSKDETNTQSLQDEEFNWRHLLLQFQCDHENVETHCGQKSIPVDEDPTNVNVILDNEEKVVGVPLLPAGILMRLKSTLGQVMLTNSVLLSLPELKIQREACDLLRQSFYLLHTLQEHCQQVR